MFKNIEEVKNFITWCKDNKVKAFSHDNIAFELSEISFVPEVEQYNEINLSDQKTFSDFDGMTDEERDELMFWSSGKQPSKG